MMGAEITTLNLRYLNNEPVCDLLVKSSNLKGVEIKGDIIPTLIDEIPILAVAASQADGKTLIKDANELRYKETDRIKAIVNEFTKMGIEILKEKMDLKLVENKK